MSNHTIALVGIGASIERKNKSLATEPSLILDDEPTGNLDTDTGLELLREVEQLHDRRNTIFMVSHERHVAEPAERIIHLLDGEIDALDAPRRVTEPANDSKPADESTSTAKTEPRQGTGVGSNS